MQPWLFQYVVPDDVALIGGQDLSIPTWLFLVTVGLLLSSNLVVRHARLRGVDPTRALDVALAMWLLIGVGARLGHALLVRPRWYLDHPGALLDIGHGGFTFLGGVWLAAAVGALWARRRGGSLGSWADLLTPALAFGLLFAHLGDLAAGNVPGKPIDFGGVSWPWGVVYYGGQVPELLQGVSLHPTPLYLALLDLALFVWVSRPSSTSPPGALALRWLLLHCLGVALIDVTRMDLDRGLVPLGPLSEVQAASLLTAVGAWLLLRRLRQAPGG